MYIYIYVCAYIYICIGMYSHTALPHDSPQPSCQYSCAVFCPKMLSPGVGSIGIYGVFCTSCTCLPDILIILYHR